MVFSQYTNIFSLIVFSALLIPSIIAGAMGKKIKYLGMFASIFALCVIFGFRSLQMYQFLMFLAGESVLIMGYYYFHKRVKSDFVYFWVLIFSFLPIILIKSAVYIPKYNFLGFVGVSYVSFRVWQLIIEIHDNHIEKLPLPDMLYFITFFPTISSGPIDRYQRFTKDLNNAIPKNEYINDYLFVGIKKILLGIVYKLGIAAFINLYIIDKLPHEKTFLSIVVYMYAYTFYLFFDFAGYSNFAIGTSYILGIKAPENFNKPFLAHNMKEFWDRWHISLSKWFGDYLFSRFVLNTLRNGTFKSKKMAVRCGYLLTMTIMGLWHGFTLFYVAYGVYQGIMLVVTDFYLKSKVYRRFKKTCYYDIVSRVVCFQIVAIGMLIFSGYLFNI